MRRAAEPATELVFKDALASQEHDYEPLPLYSEVEVAFRRQEGGSDKGKKDLARAEAATAGTYRGDQPPCVVFGSWT